ncbi:IQ domain-containing protein F5-like [Podarcis raffonei]|nr:IQ domain-containing protein F5-like [Podarcis raffonei]
MIAFCKKCCARKKSTSPPPTSPPPSMPETSKKEVKAAITIQKWWRGTLVRRSLQHAIVCAWLVQKWWRMISFRRREEKRAMALSTYIWSEKASVLLQSMFKMWLMRTRYKKYQRAAQIIQSNWRHHSFRKSSGSYSLSNLNQDGIDLNIEIVVE